MRTALAFMAVTAANALRDEEQAQAKPETEVDRSDDAEVEGAERATSASSLNKPIHSPGWNATIRPIVPHKTATVVAPVRARGERANGNRQGADQAVSGENARSFPVGGVLCERRLFERHMHPDVARCWIDRADEGNGRE